MTTKAGGLIPNCAPKQDVKKWSTFVATRCTRESPERYAYVRRHPSRQGGRRPTRDSHGSPTCARDGLRRKYKTHARPELYASTPPLEVLKVVLSEVVTGKRGGRKSRGPGGRAKGVFLAGMFRNGKVPNAQHGARQENWAIPRLEAESKVLVPLAAEWRAGSVFRR